MLSPPSPITYEWGCCQRAFELRFSDRFLCQHFRVRASRRDYFVSRQNADSRLLPLHSVASAMYEKLLLVTESTYFKFELYTIYVGSINSFGGSKVPIFWQRFFTFFKTFVYFFTFFYTFLNFSLYIVSLRLKKNFMNCRKV